MFNFYKDQEYIHKIHYLKKNYLSIRQIINELDQRLSKMIAINIINTVINIMLCIYLFANSDINLPTEFPMFFCHRLFIN